MTQQAHAFADSELATQEFPEMTVAEAEQELLRIHPPRNDGIFHQSTPYSDHLMNIIERGDRPKDADVDLEDLINEHEGPNDAPSQEAVNQNLTAADVDVLEEEADFFGENFVDHMIKSERDPSRFEGNLYNTGVVFQNDPRMSGILAYDEFSDRIVVRKAFKSDVFGVNDIALRNPKGDTLSAKHLLTFQAFMQAPFRRAGVDGGYRANVTQDTVKGAVTSTAFENRFDSLKEMLEGLSHDGVPRISTFFPDFLGTPDDEYHRETATMFFVAAVARAYEPGIKFDYVLCLAGEQGARKTTLIQTLGGDLTRSLTKNAFGDPKKLIEQTVGAWIVELPENSSLKKLNDDDRKAVISAQVDRDRLSYEKFAEDYARRWVMVMTLNHYTFLTDSTGNRRYWIIKVMGDIDTDAVALIRDQLWAEAVQIYKKMRAENPNGTLPLCLSKKTEEIAKAKQEIARAGDEVEDLMVSIRDFIESPKSDGDLMIDGLAYYSEFDKREVWESITGGQGGEYHNSTTSRRINDALKLIPYITEKKASRIKRTGKVSNKQVVDVEALRKILADRRAEDLDAERVPDTFDGI